VGASNSVCPGRTRRLATRTDTLAQAGRGPLVTATSSAALAERSGLAQALSSLRLASWTTFSWYSTPRRRSARRTRCHWRGERAADGRGVPVIGAAGAAERALGEHL